MEDWSHVDRTLRILDRELFGRRPSECTQRNTQEFEGERRRRIRESQTQESATESRRSADFSKASTKSRELSSPMKTAGVGAWVCRIYRVKNREKCGENKNMFRGLEE
jgi:hypothetical protein